MKSAKQNIFKFKSFSDRISEIDIRKQALYHVAHPNEEHDEAETHFFSTYEKWFGLNLTDEFGLFLKETGRIVTLPQLIHKKDFVIDHLEKCLEKSTSLSLQPLLEFVVALARDLREEFYPYFQRFLVVLISLLNTQDSQQIEWTLICLAHLFKTLKPFLKKEIGMVFKLVLPLLGDSNKIEITNFAAECFSFVARDIRDKEAFIANILKTVNTNCDGITGCGNLFYEIVRGLNGRFHNCAEQFLTIIFECFHNENLIQYYSLLQEIFMVTIDSINANISREHNDVFWSSLLKTIEKLEGELIKSDDIRVQESIDILLQFVMRIVDYKKGVNVTKQSELVNRIGSLLKLNISEKLTLTISKIAAGILLSECIQIEQYETTTLCRQILSTSYSSVFESFVLGMVNYSQFEYQILPEFLKYFSAHYSDSCLQFLSTIITKKSPPCWNGIDLENWKLYPIKHKFNSKCLQEIEHNVQDFKPDLGKFLASVICSTHIESIDKRIVVQGLYSNLKEILELLKSGSDIADNRRNIFIMSIVVEALVHFDETFDIEEIIDGLLPYADSFNYIQALRIIDLLVTYVPSKEVVLFDKLHRKIANNLSSPYQEYRLLTAHILMHFNELYKHIFEIESTKSEIHNYRHQIQILTTFSCDTEYYKNSLKGTKMDLDPLRYLFGILYINFKLLWEPTTKIISNYSEHINAQEFWPILESSFAFCNNAITQNATEHINEIQSLNSNNELVEAYFYNAYVLNDKPDFINFRCLLLNCIAECGQLSEIKNRDIIPIFLKFIDDEYRATIKEFQLTQNILNVVASDTKPGRNEYKKSNAVQRTLINYLKIFTKMANIKGIYKHDVLHDIIFELLSHANFEVQKLALDCMMKYKIKSLQVYKDNLYNIIDEKTFKNEVVALKIDVNVQEREKLVSVLMKILLSKLGMKMHSNKNTGNLRKSLIFRCLASNCKEDEILKFVQLNLKKYDFFLNYAQDEYKSDTIDLTYYLNPKKIQSILTFMDTVRTNFAGIMTEGFIKFMIRIIFIVGKKLQLVLDRQDEVKPTVVSPVKSLRNVVMSSLISVFDQFDEYKWTDEQFEVMFEIFVWPSLAKLPSDSIHTPTQLLKLFIEFGKSDEYKTLLFKQYKNDQNFTPTHFMIKLLQNPNASRVVCRTIMEIISNLLQTNADLVAPFISDILNKIESNLSSKLGRPQLIQCDLNVLSMLTKLNIDPQFCDKLLSLILPAMIKQLKLKTVKEDAVMQTLNTISDLLSKVEKPMKYFRTIIPLFLQLNERPTRNVLCQIIKGMAKDDEHIAKIVSGLNALSKRWADQPDHEIRLGEFKAIGDITEAGNLSINACLVVIYHCFYFLKHDNDLAMRDSSAYHLKKVVLATVGKYKEIDKLEIDYLIGTVLLNLVRNSITDKNMVIRTEGILLLGDLVREYPECHQVLADLHPLTDKIDREVDFFENLTHLQSHRQGRALIKFCELVKTFENPPCSRTLTQFILPIASSYVCKEAYSKKHGVIDASIQTIGTVCRFLPWYQYELVLRFYLNKLKSNFEYQKQIVRIVMGILDSFHFDLSKTTDMPIVVREKLEKPKNENKKSLDPVEDNVDNELENVLDEMEEVVVETNNVIDENNKYAAIDKLTPAAGKKLISTLTNNIIPMLNNSISKLSIHEASHKLNKGHKTKDVEDEHTLKVPIALAIVKLLQKLPHGALDTNLPGIFLKVGTFLKSRLKSIRMLSRDILRKIMVSVGPNYLGMLLNHLSSLLIRGYQCHVFAITLHNVLDALKDKFQPADIDKNLGTILHICMDDIFGATAAEKEVEKLAANTPEAKPSNKSFMILNIVAQNISEVSLLDLMIPFKEQLRKSQSKKITNKIYEAFKKITSGLIENKYITIESLVIFVYGVTSASIPDLQIVKSNLIKPNTKLNKHLNKSDTFIIPQAPKISTVTPHAVVKTNSQANAHILIEFGLEMLHIILKRRLNDELDVVQYINPFISIIDSSLNSSNVGVATYALKCLTTIWNLKLSFPDLETCVESMATKIFQILHKYATVGMSTNSENYHLVKNVFKAVVALLRHVDYYTISEDQLKILLLHAEQDLHSTDKSHSFAFTLLKAVLAKKLVTSEIHEIMEKLSEISILSDSNSIREEARSIFLSYFMNYSLGKKVETFIKFYVNQLSVDLITGRQSAIHCLMVIIKKLPLYLLKQQAGFLFLAIGTRMVNDDEADCRFLAANTIESLLQRLEKQDLDKLFDIVVLLLNDEKPIHCEMGAQLCTRFVSVEHNKFIARVKEILPLLLTKLIANNAEETGKFVKQVIKVPQPDDDGDENSTEEADERKQTQIDHQIIQIQNLIIKIIANCTEILDNHKLNEFIDELAFSSQRLLNDDHAWIRVNAINILESILANTDHEYIQNMLANNAKIPSNKYRSFLYRNPVADMKSLVLDHIAQLIPGATSEDTANAVMKNLLYIANFLKNTVIDETEIIDENENNRINLIWLIRKVRFAINSEVAKSPLQITIRIAAFNWILGLLSILDEATIKSLAQTFLGPLVREMSEEDTTVNPKLRQLAVKIGNRMKKILGEDNYNMIRSQIQTKLILTRAKRKKIVAQEKVNDVELAMKRKMGVKNRKIKAQKRKNEMFKGKPISKKKRKLEID